MDIRCRKTNCKYNDRLSCKAEKINISQKLNCEDFHRIIGKEVDISKQIFEQTPEISAYRHNKKQPLKCSAICLFNKEGHCQANGITINDVKESPKCCTNIKP